MTPPPNLAEHQNSKCGKPEAPGGQLAIDKTILGAWKDAAEVRGRTTDVGNRASDQTWSYNHDPETKRLTVRTE